MATSRPGGAAPQLSTVSGAAILLAASVIAGTSARQWSWPLFVWGAVIGLAGVAWAYGSTRAFGASLVRRSPGSRNVLRERASGLWARQRWTYLMFVAVGCSVGIVAGGTDHGWVDAVFTVLWVAAGVLPPLVAYPLIRRRFSNRHPT